MKRKKKNVWVRLIMGSPNDAKNANVVKAVLNSIGIECIVSQASCHRNAGDDFNAFVYKKCKERIVVFIGGMELAAPGLIASLLRNINEFYTTVFGIPTDAAARSAIENLPAGTAIITSGLNEISLTHSLTNSALSIAQLAINFSGCPELYENLKQWYINATKEKPLVEEVKLVDGLIPLPEPKK